MGEAKRRAAHGTDPHEKVPKTYLWARSFTEQIRERFHAVCLAAKRGGFPPPSEDAFVKAVLAAGFAKMDADVAAAKAAREPKLVVSPDEVRVASLPGGQLGATRIVVVDR